jgi:hypothetical protein
MPDTGAVESALRLDVAIDASERRRAVPADALLHPLALAAIGVLLLNDHVLKDAAPGLVTGKLSDVAGLAFFPLVLLGAWEVAQTAVGRWSGPSVRALALSVVVTAIAFGLVKTTELVAGAFATTLGAAQWAIGLALAAGHGSSEMVPVLVARDPTDLVALPAVLIAAWIGSSRLRRSEARR